MGNMNCWDVALLVAAGYVAAMALVRMMVQRRDQLLLEFRRQVNVHRKRKLENDSKFEALRDPGKVG